ncbi:iron complex transport system ATP-binding protein [Lachnotalea glycerini]|uniref:Iron complex transport system ATP-binding protein n=1 Tax=Lachnotalea glycerini TaxID=1763509 RepID=A0A318EZ37_9FIRM|nr:ABC transporter ATP-binding protein [Lachnotalea glycerini]PXV93434.1 iron complex transport system ATP-binding protein [Lachnotalea glycerini]
MSISVEHLNFSYCDRPVLEDVSFRAVCGEVVCIIGPNGVGKSTLFRCILGIINNYSGIAKINEIEIKTLKPKQLARLIAYIPQSHTPAFHYSVLDMTLMGTTAQMSAFATPRKQEIIVAEEALKILDIYHLRDRDFTKMSGGERQLVLIARALAQQAKVLIMDEPTANLDYGNQILVLEQVKHLTSKGYTIIQSTHQPEQALYYADYVIALKDGRVYAAGKPHDVMDEELIFNLYGVRVKIQSLFDDKIRMCIPEDVLLHR